MQIRKLEVAVFRSKTSNSPYMNANELGLNSHVLQTSCN